MGLIYAHCYFMELPEVSCNILVSVAHTLCVLTQNTYLVGRSRYCLSDQPEHSVHVGPKNGRGPPIPRDVDEWALKKAFQKQWESVSQARSKKEASYGFVFFRSLSERDEALRQGSIELQAGDGQKFKVRINSNTSKGSKEFKQKKDPSSIPRNSTSILGGKISVALEDGSTVSFLLRA